MFKPWQKWFWIASSALSIVSIARLDWLTFIHDINVMTSIVDSFAITISTMFVCGVGMVIIQMVLFDKKGE